MFEKVKEFSSKVCDYGKEVALDAYDVAKVWVKDPVCMFETGAIIVGWLTVGYANRAIDSARESGYIQGYNRGAADAFCTSIKCITNDRE